MLTATGKDHQISRALERRHVTDQYRLDWRENCLCITFTSSDYFEPRIVTNWWPIAWTRRDDYEELIGREAMMDNGCVFYVKRDGGSWTTAQRFTLQDGGQTKPIWTDIVDFPCPKVRKGIETRYERGQWQKYLHTKGWVSA